MTDAEAADKIYIEPITLDYVKKIIETERPDSLLPGMGGQTALALELHDQGILDASNIKIMN